MTRHRMPSAALGLSTILVMLSAPSALAIEADQFGARLEALAASQGVELDWTDISVDGDEVTLEGVTIGAAGEDERSEIGQVVLEEVTEDDGGYRVGAFSLPSHSYSDDDATVDFEGLTVTGLSIPAEGASGPFAGVLMYETAEMPGVTVTAEGKQVASIRGVHAEITPPEADGPLRVTGSVEEFSANLSVAEDPKAREAVEALGYSTVTGSMEMAAQWRPQDGRVMLEQMQIALDDAGIFGLSVDLGGYTPELAATIQEMQAKMESASEEEKAAQGMAMLGLMQQLTFHGATIRFEDNSLTGKVLDYVAAEQGLKRADISNLAKAVLPLYLAQLNNPEFSKSVTEAVSTFLDNPQSFTVSAQPAEPAPFAVIFASAMTAPQSLISQLGVTVTANGGE